jgi:hypothetical protein
MSCAVLVIEQATIQQPPRKIESIQEIGPPAPCGRSLHVGPHHVARNVGCHAGNVPRLVLWTDGTYRDFQAAVTCGLFYHDHTRGGER